MFEWIAGLVFIITLAILLAAWESDHEDHRDF
jgi:hypothetical protein